MSVSPPAASWPRGRSGRSAAEAPAWPPSPSSPSTAWRSFSGRRGWPGAGAGRSRRRSSPPRCERRWPKSRGSSPRWPVTPPPRRPSSRPTGSSAISPTVRSTPWPRRAVVRATSCVSTELPEPPWSSGFYDEEDLLDAGGRVPAVPTEAIAARLGPVIVYLPERLSRHAGSVARRRRREQRAHRAGRDHGRRPGRRRGRALRPPHRARNRGRRPGDRRSAGRRRPGAHADRHGVGLRRGGPGSRAGRSSMRPGPARRSIAWPSCTPAPSPMPGWPTSSWPPPASALNGAAVMPLTARVAGRTLLGLLALPGGGFRREDVFAWLAGARLRHDGRPISVTAWERLSRDAGVVAGRTDWDRAVGHLCRRDGTATRRWRKATPTRPPGGPRACATRPTGRGRCGSSCWA